MAVTNMSLIKNVSANGANVQDQDFYGRCPDFSSVNLKMGKAPGANTWNSLTAVAGLASAGYLSLLTDGGVKVRVPLLNHPDGG